jgi:archaellum component FlaF (FlaF/FlaG flagellin family)
LLKSAIVFLKGFLITFCIFYNFGKDYENVKDNCEKFYRNGNKVECAVITGSGDPYRPVWGVGEFVNSERELFEDS